MSDPLLRAQATIREQTRVLEALTTAGASLVSQLDHEGIVQAMTDAARDITGAEFAAFFYNTIDERGEVLTLYTLCGAARSSFERFGMPRATALFGPTFRGERVIRADDILAHPLYGKSGPHFGMPKGHLPVRSYLAIPVVSRSGIVHGGLFMGHSRPGIFTEAHERIITGIAAQAAVAIDNSRLLEDSREARRKLAEWADTLEARVEERTAALHRSELQFRQLVAGVTDCALYMLDRNGFITTWNPGAERIKGYSASEVIGQHFGMFYTEEDRAIGMPAHVLELAAERGSTKQRLGACVRMALASGPVSFSMPFATAPAK